MRARWHRLGLAALFVLAAPLAGCPWDTPSVDQTGKRCSASDPCPTGWVCFTGACAVATSCPAGTRDFAGSCLACTSNGDCDGGVCDVDAGTCVQCLADADCDGGICAATVCEPGCDQAASCPSVGHGAAACVDGGCTVGSCVAPWAVCDAGSSCAYDLSSNALNCGSCGNPCTFAHAAASCDGGRCELGSCAPGFANCDADAGNGCETALLKDPQSCGRCGVVCAFPDAVAACVDGGCVLASCQAGFMNCDGDAGNGCEINGATDPENCGNCGSVCSTLDGTPSCVKGACQWSCQAGFAHCASGNTGCETNIATSTANCGACGARCAAGQVCSNGSCAASCASPSVSCGSGASAYCADEASDPQNCGGCGSACSLVDGTPSCVGGGCQWSCQSGFAHCAVGNTGCETDTSSSMGSCGACGAACAPANASGTCVGGTCTIAACQGGFLDCDEDASDGCEVDPATDPLNCGGCGAACSTLDGTPSCVGGACQWSCQSGFAHCADGGDTGCETDLSTDQSCGGCGVACPQTATCSGSGCQTCAAGSSDCDGDAGNGCECPTPTCCGAACQLAHSNGLGQSFYDCAPLGTYDLAQATEALGAWPGSAGVTPTPQACGSDLELCAEDAGQCACWEYSGSDAGQVVLAATCNCPPGVPWN